MSAADSNCAAAAAAHTATATAAAPSPSPTADQHSFWLSSLSVHGSSLLQTMLLHDDEAEAEEMNREEIEEIMNMCNIRKEWTVCEWAAGMGRLTPLLAAQCRFVYASDFVASFCDTNRARCAELGATNVQVDCIDAASYAPTPAGSPPHQTGIFDLCFVNWLLLYLDDEHAEKFMRAAVASLKRPGGDDSSSQQQQQQQRRGGLIFLHESCWERANETALFRALSGPQQAALLARPCEYTPECSTWYRTSFWYHEFFRRVGLRLLEERELSAYAPEKTFSKDGEKEAPLAQGDGATAASAAAEQPAAESDEDSYYNRQMCWLLCLDDDGDDRADSHSCPS